MPRKPIDCSIHSCKDSVSIQGMPPWTLSGMRLSSLTSTGRVTGDHKRSRHQPGGAEEARAALRLESHRPECRSLQVEVCQSSPGTCTESGEGSGGSWRVCGPGDLRQAHGHG